MLVVPGIYREVERLLGRFLVEVAEDDRRTFVEDRSVVARPMPLAPPVMTATLPSSRAVMSPPVLSAYCYVLLHSRKGADE